MWSCSYYSANRIKNIDVCTVFSFQLKASFFSGLFTGYLLTAVKKKKRFLLSPCGPCVGLLINPPHSKSTDVNNSDSDSRYCCCACIVCAFLGLIMLFVCTRTFVFHLIFVCSSFNEISWLTLEHYILFNQSSLSENLWLYIGERNSEYSNEILDWQHRRIVVQACEIIELPQEGDIC